MKRPWIKGLSQNRSYLAFSVEIIAEANSGCGFASPDVMKHTFESIKAGTFTEANWFGLECQAQPIMNTAGKILEQKEKNNPQAL